jgi:hypothetical protein
MNVGTILVWMGLAAILSGPSAFASTGTGKVLFDLKIFTLEHEGKGYTLHADNGLKVSVPAEWLEPPQEARPDTQPSFSSFNHYHRQVTAFPIGDGRIGLHLSSYEIQNGDPAQAAAGRDVFLLFDPKSGTLRHGGMRLGITKDRVRVERRVFATAHTFFIGDVNGDRVLDLGVVKEKITWKKRPNGVQPGQRLADTAEPSYEQHPIRWYVLAADRWTYQPQYDGIFPKEEYHKLPLIGLVKSPVDLVDETIYPGIRKSSSRDVAPSN